MIFIDYMGWWDLEIEEVVPVGVEGDGILNAARRNKSPGQHLPANFDVDGILVRHPVLHLEGPVSR